MGRLGSLEVLESAGPLEAQVDCRAARRDAMDRLRARWDLLDPPDRLLLKMHLEAGSSFEEMAQVTGLSRSAVCRRIHRTIRRLADETYGRCAAARSLFGEAELAIIRDHFVRGVSLLQIGRERRLCYYRVRAIVQRARRFAAGAKREPVRSVPVGT